MVSRTTLQALSEKYMESTCAIERATVADDGGETWAEVATVKCRLSQATPQNAAGLALTSGAAWVVYLPLGTDVATHDRLDVGGKVLYVEGTDEGRTFGVSLLVLCNEEQDVGWL